MKSLKIWKISAGTQSRYWKDFVYEEIAAFGAWNEGSFENYKTRDELFQKLKAYSLREWGKSTTSHVEAWNFYKEVDIGDLMVLYRKGSIIAIGIIVGNYYFDDDKFLNGEKFFHIRPVKWRLLDPLNRKISGDLMKKLTIPPDTIHEIKDKELLVEILRLVLF